MRPGQRERPPRGAQATPERSGDSKVPAHPAFLHESGHQGACPTPPLLVRACAMSMAPAAATRAAAASAAACCSAWSRCCSAASRRPTCRSAPRASAGRRQAGPTLMGQHGRMATLRTPKQATQSMLSTPNTNPTLITPSLSVGPAGRSALPGQSIPPPLSAPATLWPRRAAPAPAPRSAGRPRLSAPAPQSACCSLQPVGRMFMLVGMMLPIGRVSPLASDSHTGDHTSLGAREKLVRPALAPAPVSEAAAGCSEHLAVRQQVPEILHTSATSSASAESAMVARAAASSRAASALAAARRSSSALSSCMPCTSSN